MEESRLIAIRREDIVSADKAFVELMLKTESMLNARAKISVDKYKGMSSNELELLSKDTIQEACNDTPFCPDNVILVSGQKFPDIIAEKYYGVEVKSTSKNTWTSTGSSIVETTRDKYVQYIYMLFAKLGGSTAEFKCRPYQDVLYEVAVTHSPRYLIDMSLQAGMTIFDKMGISYDELRTSSESIEIVKKYYKARAEKSGNQMPWWISHDDSASLNMNIRLWSALSSKEKYDITAQVLVIFPEVVSGDYGRAALWLASAKGIVCKNIRDPFSAGGKIRSINGENLEHPLPRIVKTLSDKFTTIKEYLYEPSEIILYIEELNHELIEGNLYNNWFEQVNKHLNSIGVGISIKEILEKNMLLS